MNNFPVIVDDKEYWVSRSIATVVLIVVNDEYIVAVQRGEGTPDPEYIGKWCLPCGYLDYNETVEECAIREVYEETGLTLTDVKLVNINSDPYSDKRQNVTFRYISEIKGLSIQDIKWCLSSKNSEEDEVMKIDLIKISDIDSYQWAFNHKYLIKELYNDTINSRQ